MEASKNRNKSAKMTRFELEASMARLKVQEQKQREEKEKAEKSRITAQISLTGAFLYGRESACVPVCVARMHPGL